MQQAGNCVEQYATLACALEAQDPLRKEVFFKRAWDLALRNKTGDAKAMLPYVRNQPWMGAAGFHRLLELARALPPHDGEFVLVAAARHDPGIALREIRTISDLPFGAAVLEAAAKESPGEAVGISAGMSPTGQLLLSFLQASHAKELQNLAKLAVDRNTELPWRVRAAALGDSTYADVRDEHRYFARLVRSGNKRLLREYALTALREMREAGLRSRLVDLRKWDPKELYLLVVNGRDELDDTLFHSLSDQLLREKMRGVDMTSLPQLRAFWNDAMAFQRSEWITKQALAAAFRGIGETDNPLEETILAAGISDQLRSGELELAASAVASEYERAGEWKPLYGLLAAHMSSRLPHDHKLQAIAEPYRHFLKAPQSLAVDPIFSHRGVSLHRYFFYDDDDGVESYNTFLAGYRNAPGWSTETHENWVKITGRHGSRTIEIYANTPMRGSAEDAIAKAFAGREPEVLVHRGHAIHTDKSVRRLTQATRLVYLGSCRGTENVEAVLRTASQAQVLATRGTGSHSVNDPLLKALNDQLLRADGQLDWKEFWKTEQARFHGNALFADYIPPHLNTQAILLRAWYSFVAGE
jgi:hypothetical protein